MFKNSQQSNKKSKPSYRMPPEGKPKKKKKEDPYGKLNIYSVPIPYSVVFLSAIAAIGLGAVATNMIGDPLYPFMSSESIKFIIYLLAGLIITIATKILAGMVRRNLSKPLKPTSTRKPKSRNRIFAPDSEWRIDQVVSGGMLGFLAIFALQQIALIGAGTVFQVTVFDVYSFFVFASIAEEVLFRMATMGAVQLIIVYLLVRSVDRKRGEDINRWRARQRKRESMGRIVGAIVATIVSLGLFLWSHPNYFSNMLFMLATAFTSIILSIIYLITRHPLSNMIAHLTLNFITAGQLIQVLTAQGVQLAIALIVIFF